MITDHISGRELVRRVARRTRVDYNVAKKVVDAFLDEIVAATLDEDLSVLIPGFGTFYKKMMAPRSGKAGGKHEFAVGLRYKLGFKCSAKLKRELGGYNL